MTRAWMVAALLTVCCARAGAQDDVSGPAAMEVTTDTRAYCTTLWEQIRARGLVSREVSDLQAEGRDLCESGRVRGGINRLRRALMVLHAERAAGDGRPRTQVVAEPPDDQAPD